MELEFKARQTSKQTNIHTNKHRTLKLRCLQPPVKMERRVESSNIIFHKQTCHIFCNHFPCLCHWHNTQSVKCHTQCQHPCYITEQHITVDRTFHDFDHGSESHIWSAYKSRSYIAILDQSTHHSICAGGLEAPLFLSTMFVCMYVGLFALLIN